MGLIPDDTIQEIRTRADIVAVIGRHVELKKAGHSHKGLCPFHNEKSPSFSVSADKGFYYCFGCQQKGDVFTFLMEYEGKTFNEAAETLAGQLGIMIPAGLAQGSSQPQRSKRASMLEVTGLATEFFRANLRRQADSSHQGSSPAIEYLRSRGIGAQVASAFKLGYAPSGWDGLLSFLRQKNASVSVAETLGLIVARPRDGHYDRFRDRLMCPVMEANGDVVGFSGRRLLEDDEKAGAKYINSPESALYKKSKLLYGLHQARDGIRKAGHALVVEGNFDVISLHQAGLTQTVAPLGTALTDDQADLLRRVCGRAVLLYDGDPAGRSATIKGLKTLLKSGVDVRIALVPEGSDPDNLVRDGGAERLTPILKRAQPAVEYFIHQVWSRDDHSAHTRSDAVREAAQVLRMIPDATQRDFAVGTLATAWNVEESTLRKGLRRALQSEATAQNRQPEPEITLPHPVKSSQPRVRGPRPDPLELDILTILSEYPQLVPAARKLDVGASLTDSRLRTMYNAVSAQADAKSFDSAMHSDTASTLNCAQDTELEHLLAKHILDGVYRSIPNPEDCLRQAVERLRLAQAKRELADLQAQAHVANRNGDIALERQLFRRILETRKQVD